MYHQTSYHHKNFNRKLSCHNVGRGERGGGLCRGDTSVTFGCHTAQKQLWVQLSCWAAAGGRGRVGLIVLLLKAEMEAPEKRDRHGVW